MMKSRLGILLAALMLGATASAENVGSLHFGVIKSATDRSGYYRGFTGTVELPKGIPAVELRVDLVSGGRTLIAWYPSKEAKELPVKFTLTAKQEDDSRLKIVHVFKKGGWQRTIETIDLAKDVFGLEKPVKGGGPPTKQRLLSGAVGIAIFEDDVELLKVLKEAGWDPTRPLCDDVCPESNDEALKVATTSESVQALKWLLGEGGLSANSREPGTSWPIDWIFGDGEKQDEMRRLLAREDDGGYVGLVEEILFMLAPEVSDEKWIVKVSNTPDPARTLEIIRTWNKNTSDAGKLSQEEIQTELRDGGAVKLEISFAAVEGSEKDYTYRFRHTRGSLAGGGNNGTLTSEHGYWMQDTVSAWEE